MTDPSRVSVCTQARRRETARKMPRPTPRRRSLPKTPCRLKAARIRTSSAAQCRAIKSQQRSAAISISRPCRKRKPTRRRTHHRALISLGIFAQENSPSPRSAFRRAEERSAPPTAVQKVSPASSQEKAALISTSKRTPTSRARSLQARRIRRRTASARGRSLSVTWRTRQITAQRASVQSTTTTAAMTRCRRRRRTRSTTP